MAAFDSANVSAVLLLDSTVVILQAADARLTGVNARTGEVLWHAGRRGAGPGEFTLPNSLVSFPPDRFGVVDNRAGRMLIFDARGQYLTSVSGPLFHQQMDSMCPTSDGEFLATRFPSGTTLRGTRTGEVRTERRNVWPDSKLDSAPQLTQARFARVHQSGSPCVLHTVRGNFFGVVDPVTLHMDSIRVYADSLPMPRIVMKNGFTALEQDLVTGTSAVIGDTLLYVLFGGVSPEAERIIDVYGAVDGGYRWSVQLPRTTFQIDIQGDRLLTLERGASVPQASTYILRGANDALTDSGTGAIRR